MFVSMMEHRSPERRFRAVGNRAHSSHLHKHYLNRHHQQQHQQQAQLALSNTNNLSSKVHNFPVLQIENQLQNKVKSLNVNTFSKQNVKESQRFKDDHYHKIDVQNTGKILVSKNILDEIELKRKLEPIKVPTKEHSYRQRNAYSREPYDHISFNNNELQNNKQLNIKQNKFFESDGKKLTINLDDNKNTRRSRNSSKTTSKSSDLFYNTKLLENGLNTSDALKLKHSYCSSDFQKSLAKEELIKCRSSAKNLSNKNDSNINFRNDPCCSFVYSSFPTLLDEVELKHGRLSSSRIRQQQDSRDKSLPYAIYSKEPVDDYCNLDLRVNTSVKSSSSNKIVSLNNLITKKSDKKIKKPLELLEKNLKCTKHYSDDSDLERKNNFIGDAQAHSVTEQRELENNNSILSKNNFLQQNLILNKDNEIFNNKVGSNKNDSIIRINKKTIVSNNRMSTSAINMRQYKSPISSPSPLSIHSSKEDVGETLSITKNLLIKDNDKIISSSSTSLNLSGNNSVSLLNLDALENNVLQNGNTKTPFIERRDRAVAQVYEYLANDNPQASRRKKLSMHFCNNSQQTLARSKSQSRANINTVLDFKTENAKEMQNSFLTNRSKTSVNLVSVTSLTPLFSPSIYLNIKPNFVVRKKASSTKRIRLISNDQSVILSLFNPVENDRRRILSRNYARMFSRDKIGFDIAQQELRAFSRFKELGIGKTRILRIADLPNVEQLHSLQVLKKYQNLQRPKKKALHEYYNDDDAELEGIFDLYFKFCKFL